jgi:hypothetical protein
MPNLYKGFYYDQSTNSIFIGSNGVLTAKIDSSGRVGFGTGNAALTAQVTFSGSPSIPPLRLIGLSVNESAPKFLVVDNDGFVKFREDVTTGVTVTNNVVTTTNSSGGTTTFTVNTITGGTFAGETITVQGSGTISNISGIRTLYNTDGSLTGNRVVTVGSNSITFSGASANMVRVIYTGATLSDKVLESGTGGGSNFYVTANGDLSATSKSFLIPNKLKPGYMLRHGSLEGPEHGVYVRGKLHNENKIQLPDYWKWLVDENTITVQLTPIGTFQKYLVESISTSEIEISNLENSENINCFYIIHGERKDIDKMIVDEKVN